MEKLGEEQGFYKVTSTCKDDMKLMLKKRKREINRLTPNEMRNIAERLAEDYCEQLYWESLTSIVEDVLDSKKDEKEREKAVIEKIKQINGIK